MYCKKERFITFTFDSWLKAEAFDPFPGVFFSWLTVSWCWSRLSVNQSSLLVWHVRVKIWPWVSLRWPAGALGRSMGGCDSPSLCWEWALPAGCESPLPYTLYILCFHTFVFLWFDVISKVNEREIRLKYVFLLLFCIFHVYINATEGFEN